MLSTVSHGLFTDRFQKHLDVDRDPVIVRDVFSCKVAAEDLE